jgi:hypothetical protein
VRKFGVLALLVAALVPIAPGRAGAHVCGQVKQITPVGKPATVQLTAVVEQIPVTTVEFDIPSEIAINRVDPSQGWKVTQAGQHLLYQGPPIPPVSCKYFALAITAQKKGTFPVLFVQRDAGGNVVARSRAGIDLARPDPAQPIVYAGTTHGPKSSGRAITPTTIGIVLVGIGVLLAAFLAIRSWRARREEEREAELQDRVDTFKEQTRDRRSERSER